MPNSPTIRSEPDSSVGSLTGSGSTKGSSSSTGSPSAGVFSIVDVASTVGSAACNAIVSVATGGAATTVDVGVAEELAGAGFVGGFEVDAGVVNREVWGDSVAVAVDGESADSFSESGLVNSNIPTTTDAMTNRLLATIKLRWLESGLCDGGLLFGVLER